MTAVDMATEILRTGLKRQDAELTANQKTVIINIVEHKKDVLYIDRTGAGKSETYFVASKMLRNADTRAGPAIIVTPLVVLIGDQVRRARAFGLQAAGYYSINKGCSELARAAVRKKIEQNTLDLLFLTPEMLNENAADLKSFVNEQGKTITYPPKLLEAGPALKQHPPDLTNLEWHYVPLLVIDEVHSIAETGHDFRLDYKRVWSRFANHSWFQNARKLGLTATVNARVRASLLDAQLAIDEWETVRGSLYRPNIALRIVPKPINEAARVDFVYKLYLQDKAAYILVFCKTKAETEARSKALQERGVPDAEVSYYYSGNGSDKTERNFLKEQEKAFRTGTVHVLFSTCALGLGYDKADIHHVVHLHTPNSMVQYYQELGRAGRSQTGTPATAHMLPTTAWDPTGWVAALGDITWFLKRSLDLIATRADIDDRGRDTKRRFKERDIAAAIKLGVAKDILEELEDGKKVRLLDGNTHATDKIYSDYMKDEVDVMNGLLQAAAQGTCLWNLILNHFEGDPNDVRCRICSGCNPGGDIAPNSQLAGNVYFQVLTPRTSVEVFAMSKVGETLAIDEDNLRAIFAKERPTMVMEPPAKWTICVIPDSSESNAANADTMSEWLNGMEVNTTFVTKNDAETRKVTDATSGDERLDILKTKFNFNVDAMPRVGKIMLYDDKVSSGDTLDTVATAIRLQVPGMEIVAVTQAVYTGNSPTSPVVTTRTV